MSLKGTIKKNKVVLFFWYNKVVLLVHEMYVYVYVSSKG